MLLAVLPALAGAAVAVVAGVHSWPGVVALLQGHPLVEPSAAAAPAVHATTSGVAIAAAAMAGVVSGFALLLLMLAVTFAAFFLLGLPELLLLPAAAALWGAEIGFGPHAPLQGWLGVAGGVIVLALTINTAAGLPLYSALASAPAPGSSGCEPPGPTTSPSTGASSSPSAPPSAWWS